MVTACLAKEEPSISVVAVTPGMVETNMQRTMRSYPRDSDQMDIKTQEYFIKAHSDGLVGTTDPPASTIAWMALHVPHEISGEYLRWNDARLTQWINQSITRQNAETVRTAAGIVNVPTTTAASSN